MNEIINWMAQNNALMIKIGFTACVILIVLYFFRFFFVPTVKEVDLESANAPGAAAGVSVNIEELAELQAEIDTLKVKLKQSESERNNLITVANATSAPSTNAEGVETSSGPSPETVAEIEKRTKENNELQEKLRVLEARLSEYEIIAEDIAEISKLRSENVELKAKIESLGTEQNFVEASPEEKRDEGNESDLMSAEKAMAEATYDELLASEPRESSETATEAVTPGNQIVIESETPVTEEEQGILDEFEKYLNSRKEKS